MVNTAAEQSADLDKEYGICKKAVDVNEAVLKGTVEIVETISDAIPEGQTGR